MNKRILKTNVQFEIVNELLNNKTIQCYTRLYILLMLYWSNGRKIRALNEYLANRLGVNTKTIQRALKKLKNGLIIDVINAGTWKREIIILNANLIPINNKNILNDDIFTYNWLDDNEE